jgi:hypothetical protein
MLHLLTIPSIQVRFLKVGFVHSFKITKQLLYKNERGMHIQFEQDSAVCEIVNLSIKLSTMSN